MKANDSALRSCQPSFSPCVTFNDHEGSTKSYKFTREHEVEISAADFVPLRREITAPDTNAAVTSVTMHDGSVVRFRKTHEGYNPTDRQSAYAHVRACQERNEVATGLLFIDQGGSDMHAIAKTDEKLRAQVSDNSADFSVEEPQVFFSTTPKYKFDATEWAKRLRKLSAEFTKYPGAINSSVSVETERVASKIKSKIDERKANNPRAGGPHAYQVLVHVSRYEKGNAFARFMLAGMGQIHVDGTVSLYQMPEHTLAGQFDLQKTFAWGGVYGASVSVETGSATKRQGRSTPSRAQSVSGTAQTSSNRRRHFPGPFIEREGGEDMPSRGPGHAVNEAVD